MIPLRKFPRENCPSLQHLKVNTISKLILKKLGLRSHKPPVKPVLLPRMIEDRLRFCQTYQHWTEADWMRVLYSAESTFRVTCRQGGRMVLRYKGSDRFLPKFTRKAFRANQCEGVSVWGSFSGAGAGTLHFLDKKTMRNTDQYIPVQS